MAPREKKQKESPNVETVQQGLKLSDLLKVKVCTPLHEKIDDIEVCGPYIEDCTPDEIDCVPYYRCGPDIKCRPTYNCTPDISCFPVDVRCLPDDDIRCQPWFGCKPDIYCRPFYLQRAWEFEIPELKYITKELTGDMKTMFNELKTIKLEIENLKKHLK